MPLIGFTPEIEADTPPPTPAACDELGNVSRCFVSAHNRTRVHDTRLMRGERRCLIADYNGAVSKARSIKSVTWRCIETQTVMMSNARIMAAGRAVAIDIMAGWPRDAAIKCLATFDNGEVYVQLFRVAVQDCPVFIEDIPSGAGPYTLTATA